VKYLVQRLVAMVAVLLVVSFIAFSAMNLLGDPLTTILGPFATDRTTPEALEAIEQFHLDDPLPVRYGKWLGDVLQGDFGVSASNSEPVADVLKRKFPISLKMMLLAQVMAIGISIPWALFTASRANSRLDRFSTVVSFGIVAIPNFALGLLLYFVFALRLNWFPTRYNNESLLKELHSLFLPALALAAGLASIYQRLLRTDLITTLQEDFVLMAKSKGVSKTKVLLKHALRPSLFSFITVFGINTGALIGGSLVIEQIYSIPGAGLQIVEAILRDDFPLVLAIVLLIASGFVVVNFVINILYSLLDPRVKQ